VPLVTLSDLLDVARSPLAHELLGMPVGGGWVVTDLRETHGCIEGDALAHFACVLIAIADPSHPAASGFDVIVADEEAASEVEAAIDAHPTAATALALLLRGGERRTVVDALIAESATYSTLQAGPEHHSWRATMLETRVEPRRHPATESRVRVVRTNGELRMTLNRPDVRNAFDAATRDSLLDALACAAGDPSITSIVVDGEGPAFSGGGDLDEFGTLADPASAHLLRVARSVGLAIHQLRNRTTVQVHGPCVGAGTELPAFAGRVVARDDATFRLPEVSMGLVPGAGGTVSVPRRIGRHRTAWMAITGRRVHADTALAWGLVDEIVSGREHPA
jgi:enoyl-CoA hydratase/carnithine racemase